mgnify:CR=1 FL=1
MTCAVCIYYDVCVVRNTLEACTHVSDRTDPQRSNILGGL